MSSLSNPKDWIVRNNFFFNCSVIIIMLCLIFKVDKILDQIHVYIANSDLQGLVDYWHFLDHRLFSHLVPPHEGAVHKLEISLFKVA